MNYKRIYASQSPQRPPEPPSPRLLQMRATSSLCIASLSSWFLSHDWGVRGCKRCGANAFTSAPVPPLVAHNEEPDL